MKRTLTIPLMLASVLVAAALVFGDPHFNKTVTVKLPGGTEATITYNTTPANEAHATGAAIGAFLNPRNPKLKLSGELKSGSGTIPAGEYTIGAIKNGDNDFTLALYPGSIQRGTRSTAPSSSSSIPCI